MSQVVSPTPERRNADFANKGQLYAHAASHKRFLDVAQPLDLLVVRVWPVSQDKGLNLGSAVSHVGSPPFRSLLLGAPNHGTIACC